MLVSLISFFGVLSILILVHEAGHFLAARRFGIWVEEFGLGLPPRAIGKKRRETIFSLNWLPFGGFVRLHGESLEETISNPTVAFLNKSKKVRTVVIVAGVLMNMLLGVVAFATVYTVVGFPKEVPTGKVKIVEVVENSPANAAGIKEGDIIKKLGDKELQTSGELIENVNANRGKEAVLTVDRNGEVLELSVNLKDVPAEKGALGVVMSSSDIDYYFPPIWQRPFLGVYYGFKEAIFWGKAVIAGLSNLVSDISHGQVPKDIAGPIGIFDISSDVCSKGILPCINFMGVLSVNLAIINILPFPALDGGRLLFIAIEAITRRRVTPKLETMIHAVGMAALLILILVISFFDIKRLAAINQLPAFLMQFFK
ncbi:RIP metalloprotease RseP [Candidatus Woesebacteria bacterium]|nr:RIP metalloprotease RseP [Candidatus Woesebacteria bacterium]